MIEEKSLRLKSHRRSEVYVKVAFEVQQWVVAKSCGEDASSAPEFRIKDHVLPAEEPLRRNRGSEQIPAVTLGICWAVSGCLGCRGRMGACESATLSSRFSGHNHPVTLKPNPEREQARLQKSSPTYPSLTAFPQNWQEEGSSSYSHSSLKLIHPWSPISLPPLFK